MEIVWGVFLGFLLALAWALATLIVRRFRGQREAGAKTTPPLGPVLVIAGILMGMLLSV